MNAEALASKYIEKADKTLREMQRTHGSITVTEECVDDIIGYIYAYMEDAKYYKNQEKFETSLTSIAYCEGLLDALKLINAVKIPSSP